MALHVQTTGEFANIVTAIAATGTFLVAGIALPVFFQNSAKKLATISICQKFDTDPVLFEATRSIYALSQGIHYDFATLRPATHSLRTLANFFASVAIGIEEGLYDEMIVRRHFKNNLTTFVKLFLNEDFEAILARADLQALDALRNRWEAPPTWMRVP